MSIEKWSARRREGEMAIAQIKWQRSYVLCRANDR